jgi:hypothetical protein
MRYKYPYSNGEEKQTLVETHADKHLVEEQYLIDGNYLVFADEPLTPAKPPITVTVEALENEAALLALELVNTQTRLHQSEADHAALLLELVDKGVI